MFEFLIALFGGAYYLTRIAGEKHELKVSKDKARRLYDEQAQDHDNWMKQVVDLKLEYEANNASNEEYTKMKSRIIHEAGVSSVSDKMVVMGLLAQKGKIPKDIASGGINSRGCWDYEEQQRWQEQRRFMVWYDKELRHNGVLFPLLFVDNTKKRGVHISDNFKLATPVTEPFEMIGGKYFWLPMRLWL